MPKHNKKHILVTFRFTDKSDARYKVDLSNTALQQKYDYTIQTNIFLHVKNDVIFYKHVLIYFPTNVQSTQCAAVKIHSLSIIDPPQKCWSLPQYDRS